MTSNLLITGGSGQLGQMLIRGLMPHYSVWNFDVKSEALSGHHQAVDLSDFNALKGAFAKLPKLDAIVHFGADPYPFASWELVSRHNIDGTANIYECARIFKVPKVIFASSTHVIGSYPGYPAGITGKVEITTAEPTRPDGFYALSKVVGEEIGRLYSDLHGIASINLRIGHTTGNTQRDPSLDKIELYEEDLVSLTQKSLTAKVSFGIYFAVSDNPGRFLSLQNAQEELGYDPKKR